MIVMKSESAVVAIDVGGTNTRVAIFKNNEIILRDSRATDSKDPVKNLDWIVVIIQEFIKKETISGICVCSPGPIDLKKGSLLKTPNLHDLWQGFSYREYFQKKINPSLKVLVNNDGNLQALAHAEQEEHKRHSIVQFFTLSTGVGAGLVINGKIFTGEHGFAQEVANLPVGIKDFNVGHLIHESVESIASGTGLLAYYNKTSDKKLESAKEVFSLYLRNDAAAVAVINEAINATAKLFASSIAFFNPGVIIVGGPLARKYDWYFSKIVQASEKLLYPAIKNLTEYKVSTLDDDSGLIGANIFWKQSQK